MSKRRGTWYNPRSRALVIEGLDGLDKTKEYSAKPCSSEVDGSDTHVLVIVVELDETEPFGVVVVLGGFNSTVVVHLSTRYLAHLSHRILCGLVLDQMRQNGEGAR